MDCVCGVLVQSHSFHIWQHSSDVAIENCLKNITYLRLLNTMQDFLHPFPQHVRFPDCLQGPMPSRWMRRSWTNGSSIHAWCALHADTCKAEASNWFRKLGKFMWCKLHPGDAIHRKTQSNRKKKHKNLERHWSQALLTSSSIVPKMLVVVISMLQCNLELRVHKGAMECHECDIWSAKVPWATTMTPNSTRWNYFTMTMRSFKLRASLTSWLVSPEASGTAVTRVMEWCTRM